MDRPYDTYLEAVNAVHACPHCGSKSVLIRTCGIDTYTPGQHYVHCHNCKSETVDVHPTMMGAVEQWNAGRIV